MGDIKVELYRSEAPVTLENFTFPASRAFTPHPPSIIKGSIGRRSRDEAGLEKLQEWRVAILMMARSIGWMEIMQHSARLWRA